MTLQETKTKSTLGQKSRDIWPTVEATEKPRVVLESPQNFASHKPKIIFRAYSILTGFLDLSESFDMSGVQLSFHEGNFSMLQIINSGP